jgi:rubredoxin
MKKKPSGKYRCTKCGYEFYSFAVEPDCSKCRTTKIFLLKEMPRSEVIKKQKEKKHVANPNTIAKRKVKNILGKIENHLNEISISAVEQFHAIESIESWNDLTKEEKKVVDELSLMAINIQLKIQDIKAILNS